VLTVRTQQKSGGEKEMKFYGEATATTEMTIDNYGIAHEMFDLTIGCCEIKMNRSVAESLHQLLEQNLFDEDSLNANLQKKVDMLQLKVSHLEEKLEEYEEEK
jgi:hypothetical protein